MAHRFLSIIALNLIVAMSLFAQTEETKLAIVGGKWEGDFSVSSTSQGSHTYAQISSSPENIVFTILLANIPQAQGWYFGGACSRDSSSTSTICTFESKSDFQPFFGGGGFFSEGITGNIEGDLRLKFEPSLPHNFLIYWTPDDITKDGSSRLVFNYKDGLEGGDIVMIEIHALSQSGQSINGVLQGTLSR